MAIDLFMSHRDCFERCAWWERNNFDEDDTELIMKRQPNGYFYAKEVTPEQLRNNIVSGSFMFDSSVLTIRTPDHIEELRQNCIVTYQGEAWIVDNVQKQQARNKNTEFSDDKNVSHYWFLQLRKL